MPPPSVSPATPGGRDDAARRRQPEGVAGVIHVAPGRAAFRTGRAADRVHADAAHARQVRDDAAVRGAEARDAVSAARGRPGPGRSRGRS